MTTYVEKHKHKKNLQTDDTLGQQNLTQEPIITQPTITQETIITKQENIPVSEKMNFNETQPNQLSTLNPENQDYWYYCSHSYKSEPDFDKETKHGYDKQKRHEKKMESLICNSNEMLHEYFDLKYQLPFDLFKTSKGIMFLRIWKAGLFLGGIVGTGLVMAHHEGVWSSPCAVSVGGLQIGFQIGVERVDDILLLHDDAALKLFIEHGHFRLGVDASLAIGTYGRDSNMGVVMSEGGESKSIYSYSFAKGAFVGISLDGGTLSIDDKVNEEFYGRKIGIREIFYGNIPMPKHNDDFIKLQELLNSYSSNRKI